MPTTYHRLALDDADRSARRVYIFTKVSASGGSLVYYTGTEAEPGTWMEVGRTMIGTDNGVRYVSRAAHKIITGEG